MGTPSLPSHSAGLRWIAIQSSVGLKLEPGATKLKKKKEVKLLNTQNRKCVFFSLFVIH